MDRETVTALSTPPGRGGIAVIRISGHDTENILNKIIEKFPKVPSHSKAVHSYILSEGSRIEECVVTFFRHPRSYTGENLAEISIHSNLFLIEKVLDIIIKAGARPAIPGEFTYRAFKNKKMDLIQAESVNELINANSEYYAEMKFGNLDGKFSKFLNRVKRDLINLGIKIETSIEFSEDQKIEEIEFSENLKNAMEDMENIISNYRLNEVLNRGPQIVIVGKVNVGKSSLFNRILLEERSITSSEPGTTRDFIREKIYINGFLAELTDVAGINRKSASSVEKTGIKRGLDIVRESDLVIFILDAVTEIDKNDIDIYNLIKNKEHILVMNKTDISENGTIDRFIKRFPGEDIIPVSVLNNINIDKIFKFIEYQLNKIKGIDIKMAVNLRQKNIVVELYSVMKRIKDGLNAGGDASEIVAEDIRNALYHVGELLGEVTSEDILNGIFSSFCIGK